MNDGQISGNGAEQRLEERIKELNCIYGISAITQDESITLNEALQDILQLISQAWQYPNSTYARIIIDDEVHSTPNYKETPWLQSTQIKHGGKIKGIIEVGYLEEMPAMDEGPFLAEERKLLKAISELIGNFIAQRQIRDRLNNNNNNINKAADKDDWEIILGILMKTDPRSSLRITRRMIYHLYRIQNEEIAAIVNSICQLDEADSEWCGINIPNPRKDIVALKKIQAEVFKIAKDALPPEEISNLFNMWLKADKARPLLLASQKQSIPLTEITSELNRFWDMPEDARTLLPEDDISISTALIRRFFTSRLDFINNAKKYIGVGDFVSLLKTVVGPPEGEGKLGGKISGVYLAEKIIEMEKITHEHLRDVKFADSWYITSDTLIDVIHYNDLDDMVHIKYLDPSEIRQEHPFLEQLFKNSIFPPEIEKGLNRILRNIGDNPIIVRSSSLLEDSFGAAFSGKYKSLFLVNKGTLEEKRNALMDAILEVYASTFAPDPIEYRRERGLLDFSEEMGILIQKVVGTKIGPYYIPAFAGVAFSNNEFRWSPRIRREDGIIRMVAGLGTRAVDRVGDDYPVLVSPNKPDIQVNALVDESIQYSQHFMDVINIEKGTFETVSSLDLIREYWDVYPIITKIVSIHRDGILRPVTGVLMDIEDADLVITFSGLIEKTSFIKQIKSVLNILQEKMGTPVDVEFAHDGEKLHILQCRPQSFGKETVRVPIPKNIPNNRKIFSASKYVTNSHIKNIEYMVYVRPSAYDALSERNDMLNVAKAVGGLNKALPKGRFILMGPGRWGSRGDIKLGVPISYSDINNTSLLIEIAIKKGGYLPDLSFGTHFFQDLVEADIHYLPLYPDDPDSIFNENLMNMAPNRLGELLPKYKDMEHVIQVIQIADISDGGTMNVVMDGEANDALAYVMPPDHWTWRMKKVEELGNMLDAELYGVEAFYVFGSTKEATAGPASDIDLLIHFNGNEEQRESLLSWLHERGVKLGKENKERTGGQTDDILDVHIITDEDIKNKSSWAVHINSPHSAAKKIPLRNDN